VLIPDLALRGNSLLYKSAQTDAKGQVVIRGVAPGEYQIFAWKRPPPAAAVQDPRFMSTYFGRGATVKVTAGASTQTSILAMQMREFGERP
jgi:hypothetical protein